MESSHSEASKLLEAALEQMDGIIQGAKYDIPNYSDLRSNGHSHNSGSEARRQTSTMPTSPSPSARRQQICAALKTLRGAILEANEAELTGVVTEADQETARFLAHWLQNNPPPPRHRGQDEQDDNVFRLEERLARLESERDAVGLNAAMAREQLERQESRMADLEQLLEAKKELLRKTEAALERERQARKALEEDNPHYSEIAHLKGRCAELELENQELRKICGGNRTPRYLPLSPNNNGSARARDRDMGSSSVDSSPDEQPRRQIYAGQQTIEGETQQQDVEDSAAATTRPARSGFKKIFGKIKRSNSGGPVEDGGKRAETPEFRRGGFRATAGGRLAAGNNSLTERNRDAAAAGTARPVSEWSVDTVCTWLECLGLGMYSAEARKVLGSGAQLAGMGFVDLEHRLGVRHYLHRKKLYLALTARQNAATRPDPEGGLDFHWVLRWLDDVGLPQYKDAFLEARVDGRVLNVMTTDDLFLLKVTSQLHHYSLRRGIQVLRANNFDPDCLRRRALPGEPVTPTAVSLWTNHRVMEWLKQVDLSEYAPNLRGSGVHGALLVHEDRFSDNVMAALLSIPAAKTLLRRHLSIHFKELVGAEVIRRKRTAETEPGFVALTPTAKAKARQTRQGGQFTLKRKKSKSNFDGDLLCPFTDGNTSAN